MTQANRETPPGQSTFVDFGCQPVNEFTGESWILDDALTVANTEHARHVIEISGAAYRSATTGQAQALNTLF